MAVIILLLIASLVLIPRPEKRTEEPSASRPQLEEPRIQPEPGAETGEPREKPVAKKGKLVIVIDDVGHNLHELKPLLQFPGKITFAVLPRLEYSKAALSAIHAAGKEAILHQPMEALGGNDPGPGALYSDMTGPELEQVLGSNLSSLPGVKGMNNHMGSKATSDPRIMKTVMDVLRKRHLAFLDSKTYAESVAGAAARKLSIPYGERSVFLDNTQEREAIMDALRQGMGKAEKKGHAVMIGHVWTHELADILLDIYPQALEEGFEFLSFSDLVYGDE